MKNQTPNEKSHEKGRNELLDVINDIMASSNVEITLNKDGSFNSLIDTKTNEKYI